MNKDNFRTAAIDAQAQALMFKHQLDMQEQIARATMEIAMAE